MNYLELVQNLHRESGSGGGEPQSLTDLSGEAARLKEWVRKADHFIQSSFTDWGFLWAQHTFPTVASTFLYAPLPGLSISPSSEIGEYDRTTFYIDGDIPLEVVNYIDVKDEPRITSAGRPFRVAIMPDDSLRLEGVPDAVYNITFDYWRAPVYLENVNDEPLIPERFHYAIVGKALMYYGKYENAPEALQHGADLFAEYYLPLMADQLPGERYQHQIAEGGDLVIEVE